MFCQAFSRKMCIRGKSEAKFHIVTNVTSKTYAPLGAKLFLQV